MSAAPHDHDPVTITVPADVAAALDERVRSGEYATAGDVVRNGLRLLSEDDRLAEDPAAEQWIREVAMPIARATIADPSRSLSLDAVRAHFAEKRARRA